MTFLTASLIFGFIGFTNNSQNEKSGITPFEAFTIPRKSTQLNAENMLAIAHTIFKDSVITEQDGAYHIVGDDKVGFSAVDNSPIREKKVNIDTVDLDVDGDGNEEIVALSVVRFLGLACTSCMTDLYVTLLSFKDGTYYIQGEKQYTGHDGSLFVSDLAITDLRLFDVNADGRMEILIRYYADDYLDPKKTKAAILQWQVDQFKVIWQAVSHLNMDTNGRIPEENKINFNATFAFAKTSGTYPAIVVNRTITKKGGASLEPPVHERLTYAWDEETKSYLLVK